MNDIQGQKALDNLYSVRDRLIVKLGSSTTSAQAHMGLLTRCENDIKVIETLMTTAEKVEVTAEVPKITRKGKEG